MKRSVEEERENTHNFERQTPLKTCVHHPKEIIETQFHSPFSSDFQQSQFFYLHQHIKLTFQEHTYIHTYTNTYMTIYIEDGN